MATNERKEEVKDTQIICSVCEKEVVIWFRRKMCVKCFQDIQQGEDKEVMIDGDNDTSNVVRNVVR